MRERRWVGLGLVLLFLTGCTKEPTKPAPITVLAASSLKKPLDSMAGELRVQNPGLALRTSFGGSQDLAAQIQSGAPADVFVSASETYMDRLVEEGLIDRSQVRPIARNRLAIVVRNGLQPPLLSLGDLSRPGLKLVLGDEKVPVGKYARLFLTQLEKVRGIPQKAVLANVVSFEASDLALVAKVRLGEADAAIVYQSDVIGLANVRIPDDLNVAMTYFAAPLVRSKQPRQARAFVETLTAPDLGQAAFRSAGFEPASLPEATGARPPGG